MTRKSISFLLLALIAVQNLASANVERPVSVPLDFPAKRVVLRDLIDYSLKNEDRLLSARKKIESRQSHLRAVSKEYLPKAFLDLNAGYEAGGSERIFSSANIEAPLFWGNINIDKEVAATQVEISRLESDIQSLKTISDVKEAYFRALYGRKVVQALKASEKQLTEHLRVVTSLSQSGEALKLDVLKIQAQLFAEKSKLSRARGDLRYYDSLLNDILDQDLEQKLELVEEKYLPTALTLSESYGLAEKNNPIFRFLSLKLKESRLNLDRFRWSFIKNLSAFGKYQRQAASYVAPQNEDETIVGISGKVSIWDWRQNADLAGENEALLQSQVHETNDQIDQLKIQLKQLYEDLFISEEEVDAADRIVRSVEAEYKSQFVRFKTGRIKTEQLLQTQALLSGARLSYERSVLQRFVTQSRLHSFLGVDGPSAQEGRDLKLEDREFLDLIATRAFGYFETEYNKKTGLFLDAAGGGNSSMGATGFGLAALIVGAERGLMSKEEAARRVSLTLDSLLRIQKDSGTREGMFYHFVDPQTGEPAENSEVSIIDTAILITGALAAAEYFGGEIAVKVEELYKNVRWESFLPKEGEHTNEFYLGWTPDKGFMNYYWNAYTDETLLIVLMALGSSSSDIPADVYKAFRREKMAYKDTEFYPSWSGGLFAYQYANMFFDFKSYVDTDGISWFDNAVKATRAQKERLAEMNPDYPAFKKGLWGISAGERPNGHYDMLLGIKPNLMDQDRPGEILVPSSVAGSIEYLPEESLSALRKFYENYPALWRQYGFTSSFSVNEKWFSSKSYGLDLGVVLISIDNYQNGTVRRYFMRNKHVQEGLKKAGFHLTGDGTEPTINS